MIITVVNVSTGVSHAKLRKALAALRIQIRRDFRPEWELTARLEGHTHSIDGLMPPRAAHQAIIYLADATDHKKAGLAGILGYHARNFHRVPYGFVFLDICKRTGEAWTVTLSHEILELLADPDVSLVVSAPRLGRKKEVVYYDLEVCDPVQGDSYRINRVEVSNFVGRAWFGLEGGSGRTNHLDLPLRPFGVRPGGYLQYEHMGRAHVVWGAAVKTHHRAAKKKMKNARRNARRAERLDRKKSAPAPRVRTAGKH